MTEGALRARNTVERLTGRSLYDWQVRLLADHLLIGDLPDAVDVPTGLGKTTTMALWLAAIAEGARLPRRLVYVVDRRAVVDQATTEADKLAKAIGGGDSDDPLVQRIRRTLGLPDEQTLPVSTLRGQHLDNRLWLTEPGLPAIVVGTVDMIGSRLLFSGYGVSRGLRPMHAGLLGVDALVLLDEAHLVPAFEGLVRQIEAMRVARAGGLPRFKVVSLSATGRHADGRVFRLTDDDVRHDDRARHRLSAPKRLRLSATTIPQANLAEELADRAWSLALPHSAVLVFCNGRKTAQDVADRLRRKASSSLGKHVDAVELLVGERRVLERERLFESQVFKRFLPERHGEPAVRTETPAFLVATSAGEVGIDLDADHVVCDLVTWERMVQRLGRLNRRPLPADDAIVEVLPSSVDAKTEAEIEIDAERLAVLRAPFEYTAWPRTLDGGDLDVSAGALHRLKADVTLSGLTRAATSDEPLRPRLTAALAEAWAMTSLRNHSGRPDVQPWIRGWVKDEPQTRLVWRRWFPLRTEADGSWSESPSARKRDLRAFFEDAGAPHLSEILEAPTYRAVDWLRKRVSAWLERGSDTTVAVTEQPAHRAVVVTLSQAGDVDELLDVNEIAREKSDRLFRRLAGRTVVVDARLAGLSRLGLLDGNENVPPATLDGDLGEWLRPETVGYRVRRVVPSASAEADWPIEFRWSFRAEQESESAPELRVEVWRGPGTPKTGDLALARFPQELADHVAAVVAAVSFTVARLETVELDGMLKTVAEHHDAGKGRDLWQRAMGAPRDGKIYGKTQGGGNPALLQIGGETYRHEFGSLRDAVRTGVFASMTPEVRDLALQIVSSHHGHGRPTIAAVDPDFPPSMCTELAQEVALRFARLIRQLGPWELAWWEALFRAADWKGSSQREKGSR